MACIVIEGGLLVALQLFMFRELVCKRVKHGVAYRIPTCM